MRSPCVYRSREVYHAVRKVMEHMDLKVNRLIRLAYGPFQLGHLPDGAAKEVAKKVLREQIPGFFK